MATHERTAVRTERASSRLPRGPFDVLDLLTAVAAHAPTEAGRTQLRAVSKAGAVAVALHTEREATGPDAVRDADPALLSLVGDFDTPLTRLRALLPSPSVRTLHVSEPHPLLFRVLANVGRGGALVGLTSIYFHDSTDEWLRRVDLSGRTLETLGCGTVSTEAFYKLTSLSTLRELAVLSPSINDATVRRLANLESLERLSMLTIFSTADAGYRALCTLSKLRHLTLRGVRDRTLEHLTPLQELETLNVSFCRDVTDDGLETLCAFPNLKALSLQGCPRITGGAIVRLWSGRPGRSLWPQLETLDLRDCPGVSHGAVTEVSRLAGSKLSVLSASSALWAANAAAAAAALPPVVI